MGYTFKKMSYPRVSVQKGATETAMLRKLRAFLDPEEPKLTYFLQTLWKNQQQAITFKELREAILAGDLSIEYLEDWQQDYSKFIVDHLQPAWEKAMEAAVEDIEKKYPDWHFDPMGDGVRQWITTRSADFVTNVSNDQISAVRALVQKAAGLYELNVDELARAIRSTIGLQSAQALANFNYYTSLIKKGVKEKKALDLSLRYAARQSRWRGYLVSRTELCFAYQQGSYQGVKQAMAAGYVTKARKVWLTADDERTCTEVCAPLDGKTIDIDDDFDFKTRLATPMNPTIRRVPPAHPGCRCTVAYELE